MKTIITALKSTPESTRKSEGDVIELSDRRLLLVSMEFQGDGSDFASTQIVATESRDGGFTWERHRVITETSLGDVNVYSPNLLRIDDSSILLVFMRQHTGEPTTTTLYAWKSTDEGETFTPFTAFVERGFFGLCNAVIRRLESGRIVLPVTCQGHDKGTIAVAMLVSDDDGAIWRDTGSRIYLPMRGAMEPHIAETRDGRLLMVFRNQLGSLFMSESLDSGETWSLPQTTGLRTPESCPELTRIPSTGDLLMIWNNSLYDPGFISHYGKRSPLTAAVSTDEGLTWGNVRDIETDPARAFSNPGCRFTSQGKAIINYWTCEYTPAWRIQTVIDLRVAVIDADWFYGRD